MIKNKRIFITGGAGFIANTLIRHYVENNKIVVYDNFHRDTLSGSTVANHPNITIVKGDVLDLDNMTKAMAGADVVIHAAGIAGIDTVIKDPVRTMRVNMIGTSNALEAAKVNNVKDRFIDFSTSEVFGSMAFRSSVVGISSKRLSPPLTQASLGSGPFAPRSLPASPLL